MDKKSISINGLYSLFLLLALGIDVMAQNPDGEKYYSNPQKGIKVSAPQPYNDTAVVSKSDDITVELTGVIPDTTKQGDTTSGGFRLDRRLQSGDGYRSEERR